jgi:hypothetical protein
VKVRDLADLYLSPPENAVVVSVDERSQIQASDRTAPTVPLRPGLPGKAPYEYARHGTTTLLAALKIATGKVVDAWCPLHRHQEFLRLPKQVATAYPRRPLHVDCDNYSAHKHPRAEAWLARSPRITLNFAPTATS